jgi:hypothetical protein
MFARNVSFRLQSNTHSDYTRTFENEILKRGDIQNWFGGASIPEESAQKIFATAAILGRLRAQSGK